MSKFFSKLKKTAKKTDNILKFFFSKQNKNSYLTKPMKYGVFSGGKRFRSLIILSTGKIFKINPENLIIIAAAVECVHCYSLIHDDLPSMDNDDYRRGKLSTHKKFNEFTAILTGNSLLTFAFEILSSKKLKIKKQIKIELINSLSKCVGHMGIAGGQYSDLSYEYKKIPKKKIIEMQNQKTGKLFGFCCESVGILKKLSKKKRNFLKNIGIEIGLLFQITDDLIDYQSNHKSVGKLIKNDEKKGKATLINLYGYSKTLILAKKLKNSLDNKLKKYGNKSKDLLDCVQFILDRNF